MITLETISNKEEIKKNITWSYDENKSWYDGIPVKTTHAYQVIITPSHLHVLYQVSYIKNGIKYFPRNRADSFKLSSITGICYEYDRGEHFENKDSLGNPSIFRLIVNTAGHSASLCFQETKSFVPFADQVYTTLLNYI